MDATFTDSDWDALDRMTEALEAHRDLTPSALARKAKVDSGRVYTLLDYLVAHQYVHTSGNGAWKHYHPGRAH